MRVLITGGTGLIGIHTIDQILRSGRQVTALVRSAEKLAECLAPFGRSIGEVTVTTGDITDRGAVKLALEGCDAAVHCAGNFSNKRSDAAQLQKVNVDGSDIVIREAVDAGLDPVIHISSYLALFPPQAEMMRGEDPVTRPRGAYSRSKADAELMVRSLQAAGHPVVTVYPASVQGPNDPTYGIGSRMIEQAIRSKRWMQTGRGRSYCDVRDLAQLIDRALQPGRGPKRYMAGGYFLPDSEVIAILRDLTGRAIQPQKLPAVLMRLMGSLLDGIGKLTGRDFPLSREDANVLTLSVPTDDQPAIDELGLSRIGARQSFHDLIEWMLASGRLDPDRITLQTDKN